MIAIDLGDNNGSFLVSGVSLLASLSQVQRTIERTTGTREVCQVHTILPHKFLRSFLELEVTMNQREPWESEAIISNHAGQTARRRRIIISKKLFNRTYQGRRHARLDGSGSTGTDGSLCQSQIDHSRESLEDRKGITKVVRNRRRFQPP